MLVVWLYKVGGDSKFRWVFVFFYFLLLDLGFLKVFEQLFGFRFKCGFDLFVSWVGLLIQGGVVDEKVFYFFWVYRKE